MRAVLAGLTRLAAAGLARCGPDGLWVALDIAQVTEQIAASAAQAGQVRREQVEADRAAYAEVRPGHGSWGLHAMACVSLRSWFRTY